jgi:hypothetical protein
MKILFSITQAILQAAIAQMFLLGYSLYTMMDIPLAVTTTATLLFFLGLYQIGLGVLFLRAPQLTKLILIPLISSLLTAVTLALYPALGFTMDFWVLFTVLFISGILSCLLLFSTGASWRSESNNG